MLDIDGLEVEYGLVRAVRDLTLTVGRGEAVALVGPNGAGKTTTLRTIMGYVAPAAGTITLDGKPITGTSPERMVRRGVTLVPEGRRIFGTLTVEENLRLGATTRGDPDGVESDLEAQFKRFPALGRYRSDHAAALSGGEQQQLAIARALLARPRLLMLDEPSLGLAPRMVDLVFEAIEELRAEGVSILLIEQNALRAIRFADRGYVMEGGEIRLEGPSDELLAGDALESVYLGTVDA